MTTREKIDAIYAARKRHKDTKVKEHGEVNTPFALVEEMLDKLPPEVWSNPALKWLDPCNGIGTFPCVVIERLMIGLQGAMPDEEARYKHIVENMLYVCELQPSNMAIYERLFNKDGKYKLNTFTGSFLSKEFDAWQEGL